MGKPLLKSKTFWLNALILIGVALDSIVGAEAVSDPKVLTWIAVGSAIANAALRLVTKEPIRGVK